MRGCYKNVYITDLSDSFIKSIKWKTLDAGLRSEATELHTGCKATGDPGKTQYDIFSGI